MAITSGDGFIAAAKQQIRYAKYTTVATVAGSPYTMLAQSGNPGAGTLTVGNTANGLVPNDATAGFPAINTFVGTGYLAIVDFGNTVACRMSIYDRLFHVGSINLNALATTTLASQPSYSARVPSGTNYNGLEIFLEINAAVSATATTVNVTYTNEAGTTGRATGATASLSGTPANRLIRMPLQSGDNGVQKIESVIVGGTVATTGTFNVVVARPLWVAGRAKIANDGDVHGLDKTGMPIIYDTSALWLVVESDTTTAGTPGLLLTVANG